MQGGETMGIDGIIHIDLEINNPERDQQYEEILTMLSQRTGCSPEDLKHIALLVLSTALLASVGPRTVSLALAEWQSCKQAFCCDCGGQAPQVIANFTLPTISETSKIGALTGPPVHDRSPARSHR
jgi:hypothetical protein